MGNDHYHYLGLTATHGMSREMTTTTIQDLQQQM
ncbi:unnamed protein product, partial [Rotaria magnacalcarata]